MSEELRSVLKLFGTEEIIADLKSAGYATINMIDIDSFTTQPMHIYFINNTKSYVKIKHFPKLPTVMKSSVKLPATVIKQFHGQKSKAVCSELHFEMDAIMFSNRWLISASLTQLIAVMQETLLTHSIVVERNFYNYYKLPMAATHFGNPDGIFILQCPQQQKKEIPAVKQMQFCNVVGKYCTNKANSGLRPRSKLHTIVDYKTNRPRLMKTFYKNGQMAPYVVVLRSHDMKYRPPHKNNKPSSLVNQFYSTKAPNIIYPGLNWRQLDHDQYKAGTGTFKDEGISDPHRKFTEALTKSMESNESPEENDTSAVKATEDYAEEASTEKYTQISEEDISPKSVLRYLSVKDAIQVLHENSLHNQEKPNGSHEAEKFYAEHSASSKGEHMKSYHNIYHRDELYNDHIFYDDLEQSGAIRHHQKSHETTAY